MKALFTPLPARYDAAGGLGRIACTAPLATRVRRESGSRLRAVGPPRSSVPEPSLLLRLS
ncbi:hypothetical protein SBI_09412 [Streptomyces bingchenggensis BCW-1]|uniref:Uncharacterized protein n=1 Tax=Streptomyces bingchenggensis (strain BCW-1) TaxID=749414 RepID=D7C7I2_STRBB|nr:hypothetical protein SBI_09412 [Streptomyces bingchenggensis BCW-1]